MAGKVFIGVSGWRYTPWRGNFYPVGLPQHRELWHAARHFNSIELNGSFYSLQRPSSYAMWAAATPPGFVFAVKGGRYITHMLKLRNIAGAMGNFFASGLFALGDKLGPVLWQFPPQMRLNLDLFDEFLAGLPRTTAAAARVALQRDQRLKGRELLDPLHRQRLRHCVEVRHASFVDPAFIALLRRHNVAWVVADTPVAPGPSPAQAWPLREDVTADFIYMRLHGSTELYNSRYTPEEIARWAACIDAWRHGRQPADARLITKKAPPKRDTRDVYCYFDNTDKLHAPDNARELMEAVGLRWQPIR